MTNSSDRAIVGAMTVQELFTELPTLIADDTVRRWVIVRQAQSANERTTRAGELVYFGWLVPRGILSVAANLPRNIRRALGGTGHQLG